MLPHGARFIPRLFGDQTGNCLALELLATFLRKILDVPICMNMCTCSLLLDPGLVAGLGIFKSRFDAHSLSHPIAATQGISEWLLRLGFSKHLDLQVRQGHHQTPVP